MFRFSLVHSCELVAIRPQSEARLVSASSGSVFHFSHSCYSWSFRGSSHGLWSLYLPRSVLRLLYIRTLSLPLLVRKASRSWWLLMLGHPSTVLSWVSFPMTSPHSSLYVSWGFVLDVLQRPQVYVSPGVFFFFFFKHSRLSFEWSWFSCLAIRDLCFVLFSTLRCFPGSCPLGCSCQPERLHRRPLAIAIAVASVSDFFISGAFDLQGCSHLTFVLLVRSCVSFLPWRLLSQYGWSIPYSVVFVMLLPSDSFVFKVFPVVLGVSLVTWSPFGTSLHLFTKGIVINSSFSLFLWDWLGIWLVRT